jgi:DNA polymerase III subunit alpha
MNKPIFSFMKDGISSKESLLAYNISMPYQLNTLTSYSFFSSTIQIEEYVSRAKELSYEGVAVCDDNLFAYPSLANECEKQGIKALFGLRIQLHNSIGFPFEACLYVLNEKGYQNLCALISKKIKEYHIEDLSNTKEGLALVLCSDSGFYDTEFLNQVKRDIYQYSKVFRENFFIGVSISSLDEKEQAINLYSFIDENEYPSIAFPRTEYLRKTDAYKTEILRLAGQKKENIDLSTIEKEGSYFLLSPKAVESLYREKEIKQTEALCSRVDFEFFSKRGQLIRFDEEDKKLDELANTGLKKILSVEELPENYKDRLDYELSVISNMHFSSYFLLVEDYVRFAEKQKIKVGPGRGSAGGSLVSFSLGITKVDPIRFDLTFERFLNPNRVTMPDIDIDFEDERRNEIVTYLKQKYGEERVSDIITFVKLKPKSALNLLGPTLGINENRLKKLTRSISDKAIDFSQAKKDPSKGKSFLALYNDPYYRELCDLAASLLGIPVNTSIHAPGVILSENPIHLSCPMSGGVKGTVQYEYPYMEQLGFLKVDILSLSNLTFIKHIEQRILKNNKTLPNILNDLNNQVVYRTLQSLDLAEIFQLETSYGMRKAIQEIKPESFSDLASTISLYRPGPMAYISLFAQRKKDPSKISYAVPKMKEILDETYGIMVYQEQVMKVLQSLGGFSLGEADLIRRAISKKKKSKIEEYKDKFIKGCINNKIKNETATAIFADIEKFAEYGFNKSHAYSYGLITYELLYYKTFFPEEFYLTSLENESFNSPKVSDIIKELRKREIRVKAPNPNQSLESEYLLSGNTILLPLSAACKNRKIMNSILESRKAGPFITFYDFILRIQKDISGNDTKDILSMIDAGCFDEFSKSRLGMKNLLTTYIRCAHFGMDENQIPLIKDDGEDIGEMFYLEKKALGRILSCRLSQIYHKGGYQTFLVTDTSSLEMSNTIQVEDESRSYKLILPRSMKVNKYDFMLLKGFFPDKRTYIEPDDIIPCERKVVKHE